jgi:hypothetical protein
MPLASWPWSAQPRNAPAAVCARSRRWLSSLGARICHRERAGHTLGFSIVFLTATAFLAGCDALGAAAAVTFLGPAAGFGLSLPFLAGWLFAAGLEAGDCFWATFGPGEADEAGFFGACRIGARPTLEQFGQASSCWGEDSDWNKTMRTGYAMAGHYTGWVRNLLGYGLLGRHGR